MSTTESKSADIHNAASQRHEASWYRMDNQYLTKPQKLEVEIWFQFPGDAMELCFLLLAVLSVSRSFTWSTFVVWPIAVDIVAGLLVWFVFAPRLLMALYLTLFHSWGQWLLTIAGAVYLVIHGEYWLAALVVVWQFGLLSFLEPHLYFFNLLSINYRMHPKYAYFKRRYRMTFPFEEALRQ